VISSAPKPFPDNSQHSQEKDIHASGGIRNHSPIKRTTADPRIRMQGHWDWQWCLLKNTNNGYR